MLTKIASVKESRIEWIDFDHTLNGMGLHCIAMNCTY